MLIAIESYQSSFEDTYPLPQSRLERVRGSVAGRRCATQEDFISRQKRGEKASHSCNTNYSLLYRSLSNVGVGIGMKLPKSLQ